MNPITNPYAPGAGTPPPELAGRDELRETIRIAMERLRLGYPTKSILMVGLRGVGKTVLLDRMRDDAEAAGIQTVRIEAPERKSLPALLAPQLRVALLRLSRNAQAKDLAQRALRGLAGFAKALKVKYDDIADQLSRKVTSLGPTRNQLIAKGMIWSPSHGDTAFTVPLFDGFMRRIIPGDDWRS